jgi:hypothetical protein
MWLAVLVGSNLIYWAIFVYLAWRNRPSRPAFVFGVVHMTFATPLVVAPVRSLLDPEYLGYALGLLRFEGQSAVLPSILVLTWALGAAWLAVSRPTRWRAAWIAAGDLFWLVNFSLYAYVGRADLARFRIQGGEFFTLEGPVVVALVGALVLLPFAASMIWAARRIPAASS